MKKISFSGLKKVMSPKEMKNITGGSDGSCAAIGLEVNGERQCFCNLTRAEAEHMGSCSGCNWCCDNCHGASWYSGCCG